jgi:hypothetical protein
VVAALLDGVDLVVVQPPGPLAPAVAGRLAAGVRQRSAVLLPTTRAWTDAPTTLTVAWGCLCRITDRPPHLCVPRRVVFMRLQRALGAV